MCPTNVGVGHLHYTDAFSYFQSLLFLNYHVAVSCPSMNVTMLRVVNQIHSVRKNSDFVQLIHFLKLLSVPLSCPCPCHVIKRIHYLDFRAFDEQKYIEILVLLSIPIPVEIMIRIIT